MAVSRVHTKKVETVLKRTENAWYLVATEESLYSCLM